MIEFILTHYILTAWICYVDVQLDRDLGTRI